MKINNKGFAISGILYTILILFLLLLSSLLALLSMRLNRFITLTDDVNTKVENRNIISIKTVESDANGSSNPIEAGKYYITNYRGKYEFTINDTEDKCYSYLPNRALVMIKDGEIKYKIAKLVDGNYVLNSGDTSDLVTLPLVGCTNTGITKVHFNKVYTSQEEESFSLKTVTNLGLADKVDVGNCRDFSVVATTDEGICKAEDDLGMSYYFRGASQNNYVYFAGFYWRIVRINGDGTIRMIYDGTTKHENGEVAEDRHARWTMFNAFGDGNMVIGYMGGTSQNTYEETHANIKSSWLKEQGIDMWYKNNIKGTEYEQYVADAIYCNDRQVGSKGDGIGYNTTTYAASDRLMTSNPTPTLKCSQLNDRFTQSTEIGNGAFSSTYPVAILTADEVAFAGGVSRISNTQYYLYTGYQYWIMTPCFTNFMKGLSSREVFIVSKTGTLSSHDVAYHDSNDVPWDRPVISIKSDVAFSGDGSYEKPFEIKN